MRKVNTNRKVLGSANRRPTLEFRSIQARKDSSAKNTGENINTSRRAQRARRACAKYDSWPFPAFRGIAGDIPPPAKTATQERFPSRSAC
jgi:hypothetical protein